MTSRRKMRISVTICQRFHKLVTVAVKRKLLVLLHCLYHLAIVFSSRGGQTVGGTDELRLARALKNDELDAKFGFERYRQPKERTGFMLNMQPVSFLLVSFEMSKYIYQSNVIERGSG